MESETARLSRRQFLKLAGATGALAVPTLMGYDLVHDARGEQLPNLSPYAPLDVLDSWPDDPAKASPILLLINDHADSPFGYYMTEILRAEGLNCFQIAHLSEVGGAPLDWFDLVLLTEGPLNSNQVERLGSYVTNGGGLVAMRPDMHLTSLFGVERVAGRTAEGYIRLEASHPSAEGITTQALQFHGTADHYRLIDAEVVAWLADNPDVHQGMPAVTYHRYGQGQTALWAFDLAHSVAYTRQGNPVWANEERDGGDGIRPPDMFRGWIDLDRINIPQADEQQRLLANLLTILSEEARPLPRLWYFPGAAETMLIATGDSHGNPSYAIEETLKRAERYDGHMSIYYTSFPNTDWRRTVKKNVLRATDLPLVGESVKSRYTSPTPAHIADWRARGHEFGLHPYVEEGLETGWRRYWKEFTGLGYGPVPPTVRTHRILWTGWVETARVQAAHGMRMNLDYYHWGPAFRNEANEWVYGHLTGSGRPMKFVDEQGRILNIYQQPTQLADDHLLDLHWGGVAKVSAETALSVSQRLLNRSLADDYAAIAANFHVDPYAVGGEWVAQATRWFEGTLDYAARHGIPIWSASDWLRFTEIRHDAGLENVHWQSTERRLSFNVAAQTAPPDVTLTVMVPVRRGKVSLAEIEVDGLVSEHRVRKVGRTSYGWTSIPAGSHRVVATYA